MATLLERINGLLHLELDTPLATTVAHIERLRAASEPSAERLLVALARRRVSESGGKLTARDALIQVGREQPQLVRAFQADKVISNAD